MPRQKISTRLASSLVRAPNSWLRTWVQSPGSDRTWNNVEDPRIRFFRFWGYFQINVFPLHFLLVLFNNDYFLPIGWFFFSFRRHTGVNDIEKPAPRQKWHRWVRLTRPTTPDDSPLSVDTSHVFGISETREWCQSLSTFFFEELSKWSGMNENTRSSLAVLQECRLY